MRRLIVDDDYVSRTKLETLLCDYGTLTPYRYSFCC
jgi:hypothetical protein